MFLHNAQPFTTINYDSKVSLASGYNAAALGTFLDFVRRPVPGLFLPLLLDLAQLLVQRLQAFVRHPDALVQCFEFTCE